MFGDVDDSGVDSNAGNLTSNTDVDMTTPSGDNASDAPSAPAATPGTQSEDAD